MPPTALPPVHTVTDRLEVVAPPARSLVVPMYQEAGRIEATVAALGASPLGGPSTEVLLVDDGSTDATPDLAAAALAAARLRGRVVRLPRNVGKGGAIRAGVAVATGGAVAFCDADLSAPPEAIAEALALVEAGTADVVVTTRVMEVEPPLLRRATSRGFNSLLRQLGLTTHRDTQGGLKAFSADAARLLFGDLRIQRFAFDVEILLRADLAGLRVVELTIPWRHVEVDSRVRPLRDGARMAVDVMRLRRRLRAWQVADGSGPVLARLERQHWWFAARRDLVVDHLHRLGPAEGPALDVGAGTGAMVDALVGLGLAATGTADATERLPVADGALGLLTALDVLGSLDDDRAALAEYARAVRPGGLLAVTGAAGTWAWTAYDVALGHRRRYAPDDLAERVAAAGFDVLHMTPYHAWLVPLTFALGRTPLRTLLRPPEEATFVDPRVNRVLGTLARLERAVARRRPLPLGLSVLVVARRRP